MRPLSDPNNHDGPERWATFVMKGLQSEHDLNTIGAWAVYVGTSRYRLCRCCQVIGVRPKDAHEFARMLRVICSSQRDAWQPRTFLHVRSSRSLRKLLTSAGLATWPEQRSPTLHEFFERQRCISQDNPGFRALWGLLLWPCY
jgi:hypothetical protein